MRQQQLEKVRAACVKANPDRRNPFCAGCGAYQDQPIRLADVLLAILFCSANAITTEVVFGVMPRLIIYPESPVEDGRPECGEWSLRADSLDEQSDECVAFLADLLK